MGIEIQIAIVSALVLLSLVGIVIRVRWEKRNGVEPSEGSAVGGWFGPNR
jgi:hypothetical protein